MALSASFLIDGFNLYHSVSLAERSLAKSTKWLDIHRLCCSYLSTIHTFVHHRVDLKSIYYFSALAYHMESRNPGCTSRHQKFIQCLEDTGVTPILGRFKRKEVYCHLCHRTIEKHEEKETDVAISIKLIEIFLARECDIAVLITGDTDIAPAVKVAQKLFPQNNILFAFPAFRKNKELLNLCPQSFEIKIAQYVQHQFSDPYTLKDGTIIHKPSSW